MLQLIGTRGTSQVLNRVWCTRLEIWPRQYLTKAVSLLQFTPSCFIPKAKTTASTSLQREIFHPDYLFPILDNVGTRFNSITISFPFLTTQRQFSTSTRIPLSADEKKSTTPKRPSPVDDGYVPVYKFKYIVHVYVLCRVKIFETALVTSLVPLYLCLGPEITGGLQFWTLAGAAAFAGMTLCVMGEILRKLVGRIYYHPGKETVCLSHLSFWGGRIDEYLELSDVVPISDTEINFDDIYLKMRLYSNPSKTFIISFRLGEVLNEELFPKVFGFLPK